MIGEDRIMHTASAMRCAFETYSRGQDISPLFISGDALTVLKQLPAETIDFCMTSPPYWNKREYTNQGIGLEDTYQEYIVNLMAIFAQVKRILKPTGSFWLNLGDTYFNKTLSSRLMQNTYTCHLPARWYCPRSVLRNRHDYVRCTKPRKKIGRDRPIKSVPTDCGGKVFKALRVKAYKSAIRWNWRRSPGY